MLATMTDYARWAQFNDSIEDDEEERARARLRAQREDMSEKEVRRLHECWDKPEFRAMFNEYAEEVSDPKHKAETEAYLTQCEAEQRAAAGEGVVDAAGGGAGLAPPTQQDGSQLLKPEKGFVVKTWSRASENTSFDRALGKVFVNVCQHRDIARPESEVVVAPDGRRGESWSMPNLCSPAVREEKDKAGHTCSVVDIVFHPEVLERGEVAGPRGERWRQMVARTAVEQSARHHSLHLDAEDFKLLKLKYFGEQRDEKGVAQGCCTMAWKPAGGFAAKGDRAGPSGGAADGGAAAGGAAAPGAAAAAGAAGTAGRSSGGGSNGSAKDRGDPAPAAGGRDAGPLSPSPPALEPEPATAPRYTLVHRGSQDGVSDLTGSWSDVRLQPASEGGTGRPRELALRVELPEVQTAADLDLDITARHVSLGEEARRYTLELDLPFEIAPERCSAKYDRGKHALTIVMPVLPPPDGGVGVSFQPASAGQTEAEARAEIEAAAAVEAAAREAAAEEEAARRASVRAAREAEAKAASDARDEARRRAVAQAEAEASARERAMARGAPLQRAAEAATREAASCNPLQEAPPRPTLPLSAEKTAMAAQATDSNGDATAAPASPRSSDGEWVMVEEKEKEKEKEKAPHPCDGEAPDGDCNDAVPSFRNGLLFDLD